MIGRILELMKEKNMTPSQFADEIGIQRSGMSHLISGRNKPSLEFVMKVLKRFPDVSPEFLFYGDREPGEPKERAAVPPVKELPEEVQATLFDIPDQDTVRVGESSLKPVRKGNSGKKLERIVLFYEDRSFREYFPG
jgi:transcriptional regulator with XRE-family HTH domain